MPRVCFTRNASLLFSLKISHAAGITDIGDIPYDLIRPVLKRMGSSQLVSSLMVISNKLCNANGVYVVACRRTEKSGKIL